MLTASWQFVPFVIAMSLAACGSPAPAAPTVVLPPPRDTVLAPYTEVTQAAWLGGDRWAVLAPDAAVVGVVDFGTKSMTPLGGKDTKELRNPATIFTAADILYVGDWGLRRTTAWTRDGRLIRAIPSADAVRGALPQARDAAGRFYFDLYPSPGRDGGGNRDSAVVVRTDSGSVRVDTIARLTPLDVAEVLSEQGRRFERRVFSGQDRWGVLPDGSLWVARVYANRVDWRSPDGEWRRGDVLPDRVLEVTRYDRELFIRKFPRELRTTAQRLPFAPVKPPFEEGLTSATGEVWLVKSRASADSAGRYHVIGRRGELLRDVRLPGQGRIVAVGRDAALAVESTRNGVRFLRFAVE